MEITLTATPATEIDERTVRYRQSHHLTVGWTPHQSWAIKGKDQYGIELEGDAQVIVVGRNEDCVAVIRFGGTIDAVACRGIMEGLERIGVQRKNVRVL